MAKIGKVKVSVDQGDGEVLRLTPDEVGELISLLESAKDGADALESERNQGLVTLEILDDKIKVATAKVKKETEETQD